MTVFLVTNGVRRSCLVENISLGGLYLRTDKPLELGTEVRLEIAHPGLKKMIAMGARVCSCFDALNARASGHPPGMGLEFLPPSDEERERLVQLLAPLGLQPGKWAAFGASVPPAPASAPGVDLSAWIDPPAAPAAAPSPFVAHSGELDATVETHPLPQMASAQRAAPSAEAKAAPPVLAPTAAPESARLMLQIKGLLQELDEARELVRQREIEVDDLRGELESLRAQLGAKS